MMIYDWKYPGEYYCGISRVAFINVEFINILLQSIAKEKWREVGYKAGEAARVWPDVFKRLRVQGYGDFYLRDKYFIIRTPFIANPQMLCGFLEGLLAVQLKAKTLTPPLVFEIVA
jgi:hypothetical protein